MTTPNYTIEQIQALAPDERALKAGKSQAVPGKWSDRGMNEAAVWGLCKGSGKDPYQTQIDLIGPAFRCNLSEPEISLQTRAGTLPAARN